MITLSAEVPGKGRHGLGDQLHAITAQFAEALGQAFQQGTSLCRTEVPIGREAAHIGHKQNIGWAGEALAQSGRKVEHPLQLAHRMTPVRGIGTAEIQGVVPGKQFRCVHHQPHGQLLRQDMVDVHLHVFVAEMDLHQIEVAGPVELMKIVIANWYAEWVVEVVRAWSGGRLLEIGFKEKVAFLLGAAETLAQQVVEPVGLQPLARALDAHHLTADRRARGDCTGRDQALGQHLPVHQFSLADCAGIA